MTAHVEFYVPALEVVDCDQTGLPPMRIHQRVRVECGCSVYLGHRTDVNEPATIANPCHPTHRRTMERFNDLMVWSLQHGGTTRPLEDVVADLLHEAARETT